MKYLQNFDTQFRGIFLNANLYEFNCLLFLNFKFRNTMYSKRYVHMNACYEGNIAEVCKYDHVACTCTPLAISDTDILKFELWDSRFKN